MTVPSIQVAITHRYFGDVDLWMQQHSALERMVAAVALMVFCLVDSIYRMLCMHFKQSAQFAMLALASPLISVQYLSARSIFPPSFREQVESLKTLARRIDRRDAYLDLLQKQYTLENVLTDGNCALRAVARGLAPNLSPEQEDQEIMLMRIKLVEHLKAHRDEYKNFVEGLCLDKAELLDAAYESYLERMAQHCQWLGHLEMLALSRALNIRIEIFSFHHPGLDNNEILIAPENQIFKPSEETVPVVQIYFDPVAEHYQLLHRNTA